MTDPSAEQVLTEVMAATDLAILVWRRTSDDPGDLQLQYASPASQALTGRPPSALLGLSIREVFPRADQYQQLSQYLEVASGGPGRDMGEVRVPHTSGDEHVYRVRIHPLPGERVAVMARDVTAELRTGNDVLMALNSMSDAFYVYDHEWRYTFVNSAGERFAQTPKERMIGQRVWDVFPEIVGTPVQETMLRAAREKTTSYTVARPAYADLWYSLWAYPTRNGAAVYMQDITELKHLEEQLQQAQKLDAVARLAGTVAHDFNNALTAIRAASSLALGASHEEQVKADLLQVDAIAADAAALTEQLLTLARSQPMPAVPTSVHGVLTDLRPLLTSLVTESTALEIVPTAEADVVMIDPSRLRQVILNVLLNARDALAGAGRVSLTTRNVEVEPREMLAQEIQPGQYLKVTCQDDGAGMSAETLSQAFEPFFTTRDDGTGLGLTSAYRIVRDVGGIIQISSKLGRGTTVDVLLPTTSAVPTSHDPSTSPKTPSSRSITILLVEDDDDVRPLLARAIRRLGHEVVVAASGEEALTLSREVEGPVDLVLTDVLMPGLSGAQVVERLREDRPDVKVLYMSGYASDELARRGINDATVYLQKPFQVGVLAERIAQALD
jgi:PAS domain S-box-containing protein